MFCKINFNLFGFHTVVKSLQNENCACEGHQICSCCFCCCCRRCCRCSCRRRRLPFASHTYCEAMLIFSPGLNEPKHISWKVNSFSLLFRVTQPGYELRMSETSCFVFSTVRQHLETGRDVIPSPLPNNSKKVNNLSSIWKVVVQMSGRWFCGWVERVVINVEMRSSHSRY